MSYRFEFDATHHILRAAIQGTIADDEVLQFRMEMVRLIVEAQARACIVDLSATDRYDISTETIRAMSHSAPALPGVSIPVIIVAPDAYMYGSTRMFQMMSEAQRPWLHVVKSTAEGCALLDVDQPKFEPIP